VAEHGRTRLTVLGDLIALVVLVGALLLPDRLTRTDLGSFAAVPVELVLGGALLLVLPARARRPVAAVLGLALGALTVLKMVDAGFYGALARPFDLVLDWTLLPGAWELLHSSLGRAVAVLVVVAAALLVVAVLAGTTWASLRLARLLDRHPAAAVPALAVLAAVWITCAATGVRAVPPYPVASAASTGKIIREVATVREGLLDRDRFAAELARDRFRTVPADQLLTGLRGKQVLVIFVESYGRVALTDHDIAPAVTTVLDDGTRRLGAAGWQSRSGYLTSPTAGGGSWLAHSTLLSGLWIDSQQRYRNLVASDRLTLTRAFRGAGWRTIAVMPGTTSAWPDGKVYHYDEIHDSRSLGYAGPAYGWARVPDQYTLAETERLMTAGTDGRPTMAVVPLVSSHAPWTPGPGLVDPATVGDGSTLTPAGGSAEPPEAILTREPDRVRADYRESVVYTLTSVVRQLEQTPAEDLVVIMVGDHQPAPVVTGPDAGRDVPITVLAGDPGVIDRIRGWGWTPGLRPAADAPVWRMDAVRDRILTDFARELPR
jgi:hypothetical protein